MDQEWCDRDSQFVALLTEVQLPLQLYVRSLMPGNGNAGDVAQQANATIWEKRQDFKIGTNFKAWAFSIARFEVLSFRKRAARDARLTFSPDLEETLTNEFVASRNQIQETHDSLRHCLAELKPADRDLLMHRYDNRGTLAEYAERFDRSHGGLKVTLHRLRSGLLDCIRRRLAANEGAR